MGYLIWKKRPSPPKVVVHSLGMVRKRQLCGSNGCRDAAPALLACSNIPLKQSGKALTISLVLLSIVVMLIRWTD